MTSHDRILQSLRANRRPFDEVAPRPERYLPVMPSVEGDLVARFAAEMTRNGATVHVMPDAEAAIQQVLDLIGSERRVLAWENLNLPGLVEALEAEKIKMRVPKTGGDQRQAATNEAETARIGLTGADAGIATTGTLALITQKGQGRIPSLLPPKHIAILPKDRLFPRIEDWMAAQGSAALKTSRSIAFASGPSSTGDIEHMTIRGVHGPGDVHVVVY